MLPGELVTAVAEGIPIVIVLVDNHGYASIGALSRSVGSAGFGTHYRRGGQRRHAARRARRRRARRPAEPLPVDLAANAESLGARVLRARTIAELRAALRGGARRRRAGRRAHRGRPLRGRAELRELVGRAGGRGAPTSRGARRARGVRARAARAARARGDAVSELSSCRGRSGRRRLDPACDARGAGWAYVGFEVARAGRRRDRRSATPASASCASSSSPARCTCARRTASGATSAGARTRVAGLPDAAYLPPRHAAASWRRRRRRRGRPVLRAGAARRRAGARAPGGRDRGRDARPRRPGAHDPPDPDGRPRGRVAARLRGAHARPGTGRATRRTSTTATRCPTRPPRGDLLPPHRARRSGFGLQRVYTDDRSLDETLAVRDRDGVLVPRGYHTVSAPPGYAALLPERDGRARARPGPSPTIPTTNGR